MDKCICVKQVLDVKYKTIFNKDSIYDFIKQEARASTHFGGFEHVIQYRVDVDNLDVPISEDRFNEYFKALDVYRQEKINQLLNQTKATPILCVNSAQY